MEQYEYYQQQELHPDQGNLASSESAEFRDYLKVRRNLYQRLLKIPLGLVNNKSVLEVGCGTGESSLVLALHGARIVMVDADATVSEPQRALLKRFNIADKQVHCVTATLDEYQDSQHYDLVTAEGWLFTLRNRDQAFLKLCSFVKDGGLLVVSYPDRFGSFLEYVRKAALWRAYQLAGVRDLYGSEALEIAKNLLGSGYLNLPSPRPFEVWWKDCMVSPFMRWRDTWSCPEILSLGRESGMNFYSSSPRFLELPPLAWYKGLPDSGQEHQHIEERYSKRKYEMLLGCEIETELSDHELALWDNAVIDILNKLSNYFKSIDEVVPNCELPTIGIGSWGREGEKIVSEISMFFKLLENASSLPPYIDEFKDLVSLNDAWGSSYCFLCVQKNFSF